MSSVISSTASRHFPAHNFLLLFVLPFEPGYPHFLLLLPKLLLRHIVKVCWPEKHSQYLTSCGLASENYRPDWKGLHLGCLLKNWQQNLMETSLTVKHFQSKLSRTISVLAKAKLALKQKSLHILHFTVQNVKCPYLNYCSEVWGNSWHLQACTTILKKKNNKGLMCIV